MGHHRGLRGITSDPHVVLLRFQQKMASLLEEVSMTTATQDGNVHYGDVVQLVHIDTGNVLASDVCLHVSEAKHPLLLGCRQRPT